MLPLWISRNSTKDAHVFLHKEFLAHYFQRLTQSLYLYKYIQYIYIYIHIYIYIYIFLSIYLSIYLSTYLYNIHAYIYIYKFTEDATVRLFHTRDGDSQSQEKFIAHFAEERTHKYDIECSNLYPSLSTLKLKGLTCSKMKWWAIYANLQVDAIVTLSIPLSGDKQDQEIFLVPSGHNQTCSYNTESSNQHLHLWNIRLNALSHSKMKWWAIYTNLAVNAIVTLPHRWSGDSPAQETFLAPSADKQTCNDEIQYSNHYLSILTLRLKGLTRSKWVP